LPVDIISEGDEFIIRAEIPGISAEDLTINVLEDIVTLRAEAPESESDDQELLVHELDGGSFSRRLRFPVTLDAEGAEAQISDGILTVRIPKSEEARPKSITVKAK
jgi:HSP20 family protein